MSPKRMPLRKRKKSNTFTSFSVGMNPNLIKNEETKEESEDENLDE